MKLELPRGIVLAAALVVAGLACSLPSLPSLPAGEFDDPFTILVDLGGFLTGQAAGRSGRGG